MPEQNVNSASAGEHMSGPSAPVGSGVQRIPWTNILPFVPIVIAVGVALTARYLHKPPPIQAINEPAPDFTLLDAHDQEGDEPLTLSIMTDRSPVVLIFYLSYSCSRCMGNLMDLDGRLDDFRKAGLQVVAISQDTPAFTRDSIERYNDFGFPLLYDKDGKVAKRYGAIDHLGNPLHGAFIVDKQRRIRFKYVGKEPFGDADELLEAGRMLNEGVKR